MNSSLETKTASQKLQNQIGLIFLIIIVIWFASRFWEASLLPVGNVAPSWKLQMGDEQGNFLSLNQLKGQVVVLDFWSTTCPPCIREIDELNELHTRFRDKPLQIVGISAGGESREEIVSFRKRKTINYNLVIDTGIISQAYKVQSLPTVYVIDKEGKIAFAQRGFVDIATLKNTVGVLLDL